MFHHRICTLIASATASAALLGAATALSPAAHAAADYFTVIAYSPITGYVGWANDATTLEEATHIAVGNCQQHGDGCQVAAWARNGCAALALGSNRWGGDWGLNADDAQANALAKVTSGRVVDLHCT
jgi:Domain of unknown function (DUF4189)